MKYSTQVQTEHYDFSTYLHQERWNSYYQQIKLVTEIVGAKKNPRILEIGVGDGIVSTILRTYGYDVDTVDIDDQLNPTYADSLPELKKIKKKYDCILCSQVLEHLKFEDSIKSLRRMADITDNLVVSVPHTSLNFSWSLKIPSLKQFDFAWYIDKTYRVHAYDGQHYWELGTKGYPTRRFIKEAESMGWRCEKDMRVKEFPYHHFFVFRKKSL